MLLLIFFGVTCLVSGILLLFFPKRLGQMSNSFTQAFNKISFSIDIMVIRFHAGVGIASILVSVTCFFLVYWILRKHG